MNRRTLISSFLLLTLLIPIGVQAQQVQTPVLQNPISCPDLLCLFIQVMKIFLAALAVFGTFMFMYGGFLFLSSGGNEDRIQKGKETLTWAALGIITILGSWILIRFVLESTTGVIQ